ncbi:MAG TPA: RNA polymerase sigma factor, partial [Chloroflexota bacterium]
MESSSVAVAVEAATQGSADAFEDLYDEYAGPLQGYVRKTIGDSDHAEDLCQEIWLKAYHGLKTLRYPEAFSSWLYQLALHTSLSDRRKQHRRDLLAPVVTDPESIEIDGN